MPRTALRIAFVGRFYWHNGSSHALLGYVRAGRRLNYDVRVSSLGIFDDVVQQLVPVADRDWKPDVMVFVFEERFLRGDGFAAVERLVPRTRRLVIDPDGKYSERITVGADSNHETEQAREPWRADFERLSDIILQPRLCATAPGTQRFLYFGVDLHRTRPKRAGNARRRIYDLVYVGNNWYRWRDIVWLLEGLAPIRSRFKRIAIFGRYWSGDPLQGYEAETYSDPAFLRAHHVELDTSVPFDGVEGVMSQATLSPIFVRPILNAMQLATPRMFETFAADTIPLLPPYMTHATHLYGRDVERLRLPQAPADVIGTMLDCPEEYVEVATAIRSRLERDHCYEKRLAQLLDFMPNL